MGPLKAGQTLVVASHNPGKVWEIKQLIKPYGLEAVSAGDLNLPEPDETETTFAGNAKLKALAAAVKSGHPALADDSGLEVAALQGAPGIYSARWAGPEKDFSVAMKKIADEVVAKSRGCHSIGTQKNRLQISCARCVWLGRGVRHKFLKAASMAILFGHRVVAMVLVMIQCLLLTG